MKFTWFNLMPWPHMPDDFREKHRSVWVDIDPKLYDPVVGHEVYNTYLDQLEYADALGYDSERECKRTLGDVYGPLVDRYGSEFAREETDRFRDG